MLTEDHKTQTQGHTHNYAKAFNRQLDRLADNQKVRQLDLLKFIRQLSWDSQMNINRQTVRQETIRSDRQ